MKTEHIQKKKNAGIGYDVTGQGRIDKAPIRFEIEVTSKEEIP